VVVSRDGLKAAESCAVEQYVTQLTCKHANTSGAGSQAAGLSEQLAACKAETVELQRTLNAAQLEQQAAEARMAQAHAALQEALSRATRSLWQSPPRLSVCVCVCAQARVARGNTERECVVDWYSFSNRIPHT